MVRSSSLWIIGCLVLCRLVPCAGQTGIPKRIEKNHWGKEAIGFEWTEQDSVDGRWSKTEIGPFLASIVKIGPHTVRKGLTIIVGSAEAPATVCYDTEFGKLRGVWKGGFLRFDPTRFGIIGAPVAEGELLFATPENPAWRSGTAKFRYRGLHRTATGIVLDYELGDTLIRETPEFLAEHAAFTRTFEIGPASTEITSLLYDGPEIEVAGDERRVVIGGDATNRLVIELHGAGTLHIEKTDTSRRVLWNIAAGTEPRRGVIAYRRTSDREPLALEPQEIEITPRPLMWTTLTTVGNRSADNAGYVLDTLTVPFENPYRALFFTSGLDFFSNGDIAVSTLHGDVWRVSGVNHDLAKLTWTRFATGLFQPLGIRVIDDIPHVLGRDQITRLHDRNADGEADAYENFSNLAYTSAGGHDYVAGLETDSRGDFYLVHATQGVVRISRDGRTAETIATGLRNPIGLGLGPNDTITVSPQEGHWTPASGIFQVKPGSHFGFQGPRETPERPLGYDPPLVWFPRLHDNSSGGQTTIPASGWGPLSGHMLHFSFGQSRMNLILRDDNRAAVQGAEMPLPIAFDSGVMRGRFSPHDSALYATGLKGWASSAPHDGCVQRVRYTGRPVELPIAWRTYRNGVMLTFACDLDRATAEDPDRYAVERWNYVYSSRYGSPEYKISNPKEEGRDEVEVVSSRLLDARTVFLELADMREVHQLGIRYFLKSASGNRIRHSICGTIHALGNDSRTLPPQASHERPGRLSPEITAQLKPGLQSQRGERVSSRRMAAAVAASEPLTETWSGFLKTSLPGEYRFAWEGAGLAKLMLAKRTIPLGEETEVSLNKGYIPMSIDVSLPAGQAGRLLWRSDEFSWEPLPPQFLSHVPSVEATVAQSHRFGFELWEQRNCGACHAEKSERFAPHILATAKGMPEEWLAAAIFDPSGTKSWSRMPHALSDRAEDRQTAADIARYLNGSQKQEPTQPRGKADRGLAFWEDLSCAVCHSLGDKPKEFTSLSRRSLAHLGTKFEAERLSSFLVAPRKEHPLSSMPDFSLKPEEADDLAAFLLQATVAAKRNAWPELERADAAKGKLAFERLNCASCHADPASAAKPGPIVAIRAHENGCLAETPSGVKTHPRFVLSGNERAALREETKRRIAGTRFEESPAESAERMIIRLQCTNCHSRDAHVSLRGELLIEESERGKSIELIPNLTWMGEKLRGDYLQAMLAGKTSSKSRTWLKGRMPSFPESYAATIARGVAMQHGIVSSPPAPRSLLPEREALARTLIEKNGGLDCRQCHGVGAARPTSDKQSLPAEGINFALIRERMNYDFYRRFTLDPPRYDLSSRMPKLALDGRTTAVRTIENGDAERQFALIWELIQSLPPSE